MMRSVVISSMVILALAAGTAFGASPVGQWTVSFYLEPGLSVGANQGICFKVDGTWYSTTFASWAGDWFQKGDRLRWYGNTATLGTAEFGQFYSNSLFAGEFAHFDDSVPVTSTRGNYRAALAKRTCDNPAVPYYPFDGTGDPAAQ